MILDNQRDMGQAIGAIVSPRAYMHLLSPGSHVRARGMCGMRWRERGLTGSITLRGVTYSGFLSQADEEDACSARTD